jgi:hypothetical protein
MNLGDAINNDLSFDLTRITNDFDFIPLDDSRPESRVGRITTMRESDDRFYGLDGGGTPVKVFDRSGRFISTVGSIGRGPGELPRIGGMAVNDRGVWLLGGRIVIALDTSGRAVDRNDSLSAARIDFFDGRLVASQGRSATVPGGRRTLLELFSSDLRPVGSVLGADLGSIDVLAISGSVVYPSQSIMFGNGNALFIKETLSDTVFVYKPGTAGATLEPSYLLDMGRYYIPLESYGAKPAVPWSGPWHSIVDIFDCGRWLLARLESFDGEAFSTCYILFDRNEGVSNGSVAGVSVTGPDGEKGLFVDGIAFTPMYVRDNRLVGYMQALDIVDNAAGINNPDLAALAATLKEDDNPVIVVASLKK